MQQRHRKRNGAEAVKKFHNILYVSFGTDNETDGLKQALSLARNNQSPLKVLVLCPQLPETLGDYRENYKKFLVGNIEAVIKTTRSTLKMEESDVPAEVRVESGSMASHRIIQTLLRDVHDLVVKEAEIPEDRKGFKAVDMDLLRKCPCPVWLCRPIRHSRDKIRVAVAIDPESEEQAAYDLSLRMLELSRSVADTCNSVLDIVSCWDFEYESYLRENPWSKVPEENVQKIVNDTQIRHINCLESLIKKSGIGGKYAVHHHRGRPDKIIPLFTQDNKIDILVMGTVARTGIAGFTIGNTAENVVRKLGCSLLALKPNGFVSPVKAYD